MKFPESSCEWGNVGHFVMSVPKNNRTYHMSKYSNKKRIRKKYKKMVEFETIVIDCR